MITNKIETLDEVMEGFERVEEISEVILLGINGGIRRIILSNEIGKCPICGSSEHTDGRCESGVETWRDKNE